MINMYIILSGVLAYLIGSIPSAVWFGKLTHGVDVREHGSGNPGATNTFRVLGKRAGTVVLLFDIAKGLLATSLAMLLLNNGLINEDKLVLAKLILGVIAVFGHLFPIFLKFKGGKGVATLFGVMIGIQLPVALVSLAIFLITLLASKYVSLGSMVAALSFPLMLTFVPRFKTGEPVLVMFGFFLAIVVFWSHHKNVKRILQGEESKTYLIKNKNNS
jgi:acyl phosphate:glycerol-3-phosphate acyltransferase